MTFLGLCWCWHRLVICFSDFGFRKADSWSTTCVFDPKLGAADPHAIPACSDCGFYQRSRGYRNIPGDTCQGGVDFRYDPEKKVFRARRAGDKVSFNGTDFIVDDVNENELILQDQSNQKKTSLPFTP